MTVSSKIDQANPHESLTVRSMFGKRMENPAMSHPLVSLGPGAGYRTHIVVEDDPRHLSEAPTGLRVVSEVAATRFVSDEERRQRPAFAQHHDDTLSEGEGQHDPCEGKRDGDSTRRLGRSRKSQIRDSADNHFDVIQRWRPRGRLARWLGFLAHEDAVATPPGTSIPNALARYRVSLLQMRRRAERIRSIPHARPSHALNLKQEREQRSAPGFTTPSLFTEILPHDGLTRTRTTQSHSAAARSASGISDPSNEPCLFTDYARTGGRLGRQQSHRARAREAARLEGGSDTGTESNPLLGPR